MPRPVPSWGFYHRRPETNGDVVMPPDEMVAEALGGSFLGGSLACSTADSSRCATWTVEASSIHGDVAEFVTGDNPKDYGQFHMPFKITVSALPK